jgi:hypothetical protein
MTVDDLHNTVEKFPANINIGDQALGLCGSIVRHLLGLEWMQKHLLPSAPLGAYLRLDESVPQLKKHARILRFVDFTEALFNMRHVPGIEATLSELIDGKIESACAWHRLCFMSSQSSLSQEH